MDIRSRIAIVALVLCAPAFGQGSAVTYQLDPESGYTEGCYPPCHCPLFFADDLTGSFDLTFIDSTPDHFDHYAASAVDWSLNFGGQIVHVTGSGLYDIGGEVALTHRLQLDLSMDGGALEHFDSDLVPIPSSFPRIDITVSMNGMVCFDKVFDVHAGPVTLGDTYCASNPNSTGAAAVLSATGSAVVADDDFTLLAHGAPAGVFGIFFFGPQQAQVPFGEGVLCVGGSILRFNPPIQTDGLGNVVRPVDLGAPPAEGRIVPGSGWNFQFWFRDTQGGPAGFNLSSAVHVDFL